MIDKSKKNIFWETVKSVRLAFILLWMIIAVSFIGALLPAEQQPLVYASVWFYSLIGLFALNLFTCGIDRIFFHRQKIGSTVTHAAVLVILVGSLISVCFGFRGHLELPEGEGSDRFLVGDRERPLPFNITLQDFSLQWYDIDKNHFPVRVRVEDASFKTALLAQPGVVYPLGKTGYSISVLRYLPHFVFDEDHMPVSVSDQPQNPALLVHITGSGVDEDRWIFSLHPDLQMGGDPNIRFRFDLEPQIKEFRSTVKVFDPSRNVAFTRDIKVNSPLEYKGYTLYQSRYDSAGLSWTGFDVVFDPGVKVVFLGFILLNLGIIAIFYPKLKTSLANSSHEKT